MQLYQKVSVPLGRVGLQTRPGMGPEPSCEVLGELSHLGQGAVHHAGDIRVW